MWVISKLEVKQSQYSGTLFRAWMPLIEISEVSSPNIFGFVHNVAATIQNRQFSGWIHN